MQEDTATVVVSYTVKLTADANPGLDADGNQLPFASAEDKAQSTVQLIQDQIAASKRQYDTGVEIAPGGKVIYVGRDEVALT